MAKDNERRAAIEMRKNGHSYNSIKKVIKVSKSSLSRWLQDYPLSIERVRELRDWSAVRIEKYRNTRKRQREIKEFGIYQEQKVKILPLSPRDVFIAGLFLYWGEGGKTRPYDLTITNTDPAVHNFFIYWLRKNWGISRSQFHIILHLYSDMNPQKEMIYWSKKYTYP